MTRLLKLILVLSVSIVLTILAFPVNRRMLFQQLTNDCANRSTWIYDRISENEKPIDIAFLGSSHTMNGIDDILIQEKLKNCTVNLGYCRFGEDLIYVFLNEIIKTKKLKTVIIEIRENEDRNSHPIFPYIAETKDVLLAAPLFNKDLLGNYYRHLYYRLEVIKNFLFHNLENVEIRRDEHGFSSFPDTASLELLKKMKNIRSIKKPGMTRFERNFFMKFPRTYLKKIHEICLKKNIRIIFLYLPAYESNIKIPNEYETYIKYGEVLIPPADILAKTSNWYDESHLNQTGARELSIWISEELIKK